VKHAPPRWDGDAAQFIDQLLVWMAAAGSAYYDESVTQFEHALQSAALAQKLEQPEEIVAACFLHDVGHLFVEEHSGEGDFLDVDMRHEQTGSKWLSRAFDTPVTRPIELHVAAKRYLCAVEARYLLSLSASSKRSLMVQGGPMSSEQVVTFSATPGSRGATIVRRIDDQAKVPGLKVPPASAYRDILIRQVRAVRP
jgi:[1-hydroxy-2-(trimethylamino)ethyl]phosphonate dioxygenase